MAEFTAAGTAYANYGVDTIPFYIDYSMFGFQRVGDLVWAFADSRGKGFLLGGTAGRTTLSGEGLQHQDGHSLLLASTIPTLAAYDPAFAYEIAVIVRDGIRRMYENREDLFYYMTLYNETIAAGHAGRLRRGHPQGHLPFPQTDFAKAKARVQLFGGGLRQPERHGGPPDAFAGPRSGRAARRARGQGGAQGGFRRGKGVLGDSAGRGRGVRRGPGAPSPQSKKTPRPGVRPGAQTPCRTTAGGYVTILRLLLTFLSRQGGRRLKPRLQPQSPRRRAARWVGARALPQAAAPSPRISSPASRHPAAQAGFVVVGAA